MLESILLTIREALGVQEDESAFDLQILLGINTAISELGQLGLPGANGFVVNGIEETWSDLLSQTTNLEMVKMYVALTTRLFFDPPGTSFLLTALNSKISELGWRITTSVDSV